MLVDAILEVEGKGRGKFFRRRGCDLNTKAKISLEKKVESWTPKNQATRAL